MQRRSIIFELDGEGPLYLQVYRAIRRAILSGRLRPGTDLPSTRALAADLGISRNVALLAYDQLLAEGYTRSRHGAGTFVATELPDTLTNVTNQDRGAADRGADGARRLAPFGERLLDALGTQDLRWNMRRRPLAYDFRYGRPATAELPYATWCRILTRWARRVPPRRLDYGPPEGVEELRAAIAEYLQRARGVACDLAQVLIVNGSQQALDLAARLLLGPGDRALLEEPHYTPARLAFASCGAEITVASVDEEGLDVAAIPARRGRVRLAYVTPSHQFPTGATMPLARRIALLDWAARVEAYVLEDDYDSEYRYDGRPLSALQGLDRAGRVLYAGTFSKLMFPALRVGYVVVPAALIEPFRAAKALADTGSPPLEQLALAEFVRDGHFERHLRRSRVQHAAKRATLLAAIERFLGDRVRVRGDNAGLHVLLELVGRRARDAELVRRKARAEGVAVYPAAPFYLRPPPRAELLLGYGSLPERDIREGVRRLARVIG